MAKALIFVLACALFVAALAEFEMDEETRADMDFIKRDSHMQEWFEAEKRGMGRNMKKYKFCPQFDMDCWCSRRSKKVVFCSGAGDGNGI